MTQKKYSLHSIQPMITIDEKSIKFIPIFSISQANEMKEHVPSSSSSGVRQRIENYLKFSLNFKYSANIDCIIYISFSATINNSADNLRQVYLTILCEFICNQSLFVVFLALSLLHQL